MQLGLDDFAPFKTDPLNVHERAVKVPVYPRPAPSLEFRRLPSLYTEEVACTVVETSVGSVG
jgi:hypothetical protein